MEILIKAAQLLASLSILVVVHEFGHFAFAKLFKTKVEKFYLFFNPWFSLVKFKYVDGKWKLIFFESSKNTATSEKTEYGIGWLPLGGYVKIAGMIDESMDKAQMALPPQPWEFRAKPAWQRLFVMIGGVLFNFILAIFIYIMMLYSWGETYLPTKNVKYGIMVTDSIATRIGLKNGDKIASVCGREVDNFARVIPELLLNNPKSIEVERNGEFINFDVTDEHIAYIIKHQKSFFEVRFPFVVGKIAENSPAEKGGLKVADKIIGIETDTFQFYDEYKARIGAFKGKTAAIIVEREGKAISVPIAISNEGTIGVYPDDISKYFELKKVDYSLISAVPQGITKGYRDVKDYLKQFKLLFTPETEAYKSVGGFISIGKIFPAEWDWQRFWALTAFISIILAVVNILPIPALDGGHVVFVLYEMVTRRKPSDKFMEYAQMVGMVILLGLLIYANGNDIINLFK